MNTNLIYIFALFGTLLLFAAALADLRLGVMGALCSRFVPCCNPTSIACVPAQEQGSPAKAALPLKHTMRVYTRLLKTSAALADVIPKYKARDIHSPRPKRAGQTAGYINGLFIHEAFGFNPRSIGMEVSTLRFLH